MKLYLALLQHPGVKRLIVSVLPGRLAYGMINLTVFFYVHHVTHSLTIAGLAIGVETMTSSVTAGIRGYTIDRYGQTKPLLFFVPLWTLCVVMLSHAHDTWHILLATGLIGLFSAPINLSSRPLWRAAVPAEELRTAYALDTTLSSSAQVMGPVIATTLSLSVGGNLALYVNAAFMFIGGTLMITMPLSRNWKPEPNPGGALAALKHREFQLLAIEGGIFGLAWGLLEIGVPSSATAINRPELTAPLLATLTVAGVIGGLIVGSFKSSITPLRGFKYSGAALSCAILPLSFVQPGIAMGAVLLSVGAILGFAQVYHWEVVEAVRPQGTAASAQAWLWTIEGSMLAIGSALGGALVDHVSISAPFVGTTIGLLLSTALVWFYIAPRLPQADRPLSDRETAEALADTESATE